MSSEVPHISLGQDVWLPFLRSRLNMGRRAVASIPERDVQLRAFDSELGFLENTLYVAKRTRNTLVPACALPTEILSYVFALVQGLLGGPQRWRGPEDEVSYDLGWMYVLHVCSYWREVALGTPSLWATVDDCFQISSKLAPIIWERSMNLPLSLTFNHDVNESTYFPDMPTFLSKWMTDACCSRLRSLKLQNVSTEDFNAFWPYFPKLTGNLVHLTLSLEEENSGDRDVLQIPPSICAVIRNLALYELCFEDCIPCWNPPAFCESLTRLELRYFLFIDDEYLPTFQQLATALMSLHYLEELELCDFSPMDIPGPGIDPIVLQPGFKKLSYSVSEGASNALAFLSHLVLPPSSASHIGINDNSDDFSENSDSLANAMLTFCRFGRVNSQPIEIVADGNSILFGRDERERSIWTVSVDFNSGFDSGLALYRRGETKLVFHGYYRSVDHGRRSQVMLGHCIFAAPLQNLRAITLSHRAINELVEHDLLSELSVAQGVRRLGTDLPGSRALFTELKIKGQESYRVFPYLGIIHVHIRRPVTNTYQRDEDWERVCHADLIELITLVKNRKEGGAPLQEIAIEKGMAGWAVWNSIRRDVPVTLLDF